MNLTRMHAVVPILPLALVALIASSADAPSFVPKEGAVVKRTLEMKGTRELSSEAMEAGDDRQTNPNPNRRIDLGSKFVVTDTYEKCAGDRIESLKRTYESLAKGRTDKTQDQKGADVSKVLRETCDLEGQTVTFKWNAEKKTYEMSFDGADEGAHDEELLRDLELDMDYREFLPDDDVEPGVKWERDFADLKTHLLRPGGDLPFHTDTPMRSFDLRMRNAVWDATQGKIELELGPVTEEDGQKLGHIKFRGTTLTEAALDAEPDERGPKLPSRYEVRDEQQIEGELVWDLGAARARSIAWNSKGTMMLKISFPAKSRTGEDVTGVQAQTFDTDYDYTGSFEVQ